MKGIFTCKGSLILPKSGLDKLIEFYNSNTIENDTNNIYISNDYFNYFDNNTNVILKNVTTLSLSELKNILGIGKPAENTQTSSEASDIIEDTSEELISDDSIINNPFFTTLKPIDE